jgi:anti-sigma factor ChrR (cupin superfamily)
MHKHFCLKCAAVVAEGDFDCGRDADHDDLKLCNNCVARVARTKAYLGHLKQQSQIRPSR